MDRVPVKSSNVAEIGFDGETVEILFSDGALYQCAATPQLHADLMASPSKGRFIHTYLKDLKRCGAAQISASNEGPKCAVPPRVEEPAITVEADDCCQKPLQEAIRKGNVLGTLWYCPNCGEPWRRFDEGLIKVWRAVPSAQVIGGRRLH